MNERYIAKLSNRLKAKDIESKIRVALTKYQSQLTENELSEPFETHLLMFDPTTCMFFCKDSHITNQVESYQKGWIQYTWCLAEHTDQKIVDGVLYSFQNRHNYKID